VKTLLEESIPAVMQPWQVGAKVKAKGKRQSAKGKNGSEVREAL
jgi:hypothetical protein